MDITLLDQTLLVQITTCFVAGLLSALTPCVYPLIPVTISIFTSECPESRAHQFARSCCFALGICFIYTILGLLAANAGIFFGSYLGGNWFIFIVSLLLGSMVLSHLGIVHFPFFSTLQCLGNKICGEGCFGAFLLGTGSGLIAAPCVGPILATILVIAASHQNSILGGMLLFIYSLGLSIPFLLLGTFSGLLSRLPKSGYWLNWVKFITASGILLTIAYFHRSKLDHLFSEMPLYRYPLALGGIFAFGILFARIGIYRHLPFIKLFGALLCSVVIYNFTIFTLQESNHNNNLVWHSSIEDAFKNEHSDIVLVDSFATWCSTCKQLEEETFQNPQIQPLLQSLTKVKIDFSDYDSTATAFSKKFNVQGIPTIIFLDQNGSEIAGTRINGFISAAALESHLSLIATKAKELQQKKE